MKGRNRRKAWKEESQRVIAKTTAGGHDGGDKGYGDLGKAAGVRGDAEDEGSERRRVPPLLS